MIHLTDVLQEELRREIHHQKAKLQEREMDWIFTIVPQELPEQLASCGEMPGQIGGEGRPLVPSRVDETPFPRKTGRNRFDHVVLEPLEGTGPDEAHHPRRIGQRINRPADQHEGPGGLVRAFCRDQ